MRKGRLVGQEAFFFDKVSGWSDGEVLSAFVRQFYAKAVVPAPELLLSEAIPEAELVTEWLSGLAGRRVQLTAPQRGARREFVAMAEANAAIALQNHLLSRDDRQQYVLEELRRALSLPGAPNRIEGYDISNIQGTEQVGSMVVWENGDLKKDDYKRFRIRTVAGADDFASLREVLTRRFAKALEQGSVLPDLVLIDGGRGQLNVGLSVLQELGLDWLPVIALAKQQEEVYVGESPQPLALDPTSPALHTLQQIRDEAHRFAITYHKKLRDRRTIQSVLDAIPGVGPDDPHEPAQDARLGPPRARGLGGRAGRGAEGHAQAGPADPRPFPCDSIGDGPRGAGCRAGALTGGNPPRPDPG